MKKKRILLLSEGFGVGHTQAAQALAVGLRQLSPNLQTRVMELGSFLHPTAAPLILSVYKKTVTSQPKLWGVMYRHQANKSLNRFTQLALHRLFYAQTAEIIRQLKPQAIVCTHPFPSAVISRLKRASGLDVPLFTVITDYDAHGTWVSSGVDQYFVSAAEVKDKLTLKGISPDKINVSGIPIHPRFWETRNKDELRNEFQLKKMPTVMIMGGGWGLMGDKDLFRYIAEWRDRVQLLFCLGSNKKILDKLSSDPLFQHENIRLFGFTKDIDKLMGVSDLLITKPGGMTCTEGLAKGIPMLFYNSVSGQEEENLNYFTENGHGELIESHETIHHWFSHLIKGHPNPSNQLSAVSSAPYNPQSCAQSILESI